eukprot:6618297-Prymnesium_polylepis.1
MSQGERLDIPVEDLDHRRIARSILFKVYYREGGNLKPRSLLNKLLERILIPNDDVGTYLEEISDAYSTRPWPRPFHLLCGNIRMPRQMTVWQECREPLRTCLARAT